MAIATRHRGHWTCLKKGQEIVQSLLLRSFVKAHATRVEENTVKSYSEKIVRHIKQAWLAEQGFSVSCDY